MHQLLGAPLAVAVGLLPHAATPRRSPADAIAPTSTAPQFPESAFLHIRYSSFLIGARKQNQVRAT